jgi:hypothetical protein
MRRRRRRSRPNPLTTPELVVGGLVALAAVGTGFYLWWSYNQGQQNNLAAVNAATGQTVLPGGSGAPTASQIGAQAALNQGALATAQGGTAAPTTGTTYVSQ